MCSKPKAYRARDRAAPGHFCNTVARYLSAEEVPRYKPREPRPTKLGAFEAYILDRMAAAAPEIIAAPALLRELRARGYDGQLRSLQAFMNAHKSVPKPDPVVRFETGSVGRCSAISLSSVEAPTRFTPSPPRSASVVGAGHASPPMNAPRRWSPVIMRCSKPWAAFLARSLRQRQDHRCRARCVWRRSTPMARRVARPGQAVRLPAQASQPYRAQTKGKVERFHRYLRGNFMCRWQASSSNPA